MLAFSLVCSVYSNLISFHRFIDALQSAIASKQLDDAIPVHLYADSASTTTTLSKSVIQCRSLIAATSIVEPIANERLDLQTSMHVFINLIEFEYIL